MNKDVLSGAILLGVAGAYYWATLQIPHSSLSDEVGAQGLPTILAVLLAAVAVFIVVRGIVIARRKSTAAVVGVADDEPDASPRRALGLLAIGAGYLIVAPVLGYGPAVALLVAAVATYEGMRPSWRLAATAIGGAIAFWLLFVQVLGVEQPTGLLF
jgi:hypothetical protein